MKRIIQIIERHNSLTKKYEILGLSSDGKVYKLDETKTSTKWVLISK
mgnify:CR=1 FL=1